MNAPANNAAATSATVNPITAEMIRHALLAIPNQIDLNITRTAYSPIIYVYKDFACGIVDPEGRLICQGKGSIPLFVANALGVAVRDGLRDHPADATLAWLHPLHNGEAFGWAGRIVVLLSGLMPWVLGVTGVWRWWHKRRARQGRP